VLTSCAGDKLSPEKVRRRAIENPVSDDRQQSSLTTIEKLTKNLSGF
jgi:hypothetical protein